MDISEVGLRINLEQKNTLLYMRNLERQKRQNRFKSSSTTVALATRKSDMLSSI